MGEKKIVVNATPYDDAFRTMMVDCPRLILPLLNEAFGELYDGREEIFLKQNEHFIKKPNSDGQGEKRETDTIIEVRSRWKRQESRRKQYHLECQSTPDGSITTRMFEYDSQTALENAIQDHNELTVTFPNSAILYLRHTPSTPEEMRVTIQTRGGSVSYGIPVLKLIPGSWRELIRKDLYFLLPFYLFTYDKQLDQIERDQELLDELVEEYRKIMEQLEKSCECGKINTYEKLTIRSMMCRVLEGLTVKRQKVQRGVKKVMGGQVLEYEAKTILKSGIEIGRKNGIEQVYKDMILTKYKKGESVAQMAAELEQSEEFVRQLLDELELPEIV